MSQFNRQFVIYVMLNIKANCVFSFSYLCGYIYLKSLDADQTRSLFIHVPPPRDDLSVAKISDVILSVIKQCVKQLDECPSSN